MYDRVYWMPYRQFLQVTVEIPWFLNVKVPIRFMTTFGEYDVNRSVLPKFAVALDSTLEQTDLGEHWRRRRSGLRCPEVATGTDSARVSCGSETGYYRAGVRDGGGRWEIHYPPRDSLLAFSGWGDEMKLNLAPEDEERIRETIAALGELQEQLPADWVGRMSRHVAFESFADLFRFNRVQGVSLGGGYQIRPGAAFTTLIGAVRYGVSDRRVTGSL